MPNISGTPPPAAVNHETAQPEPMQRCREIKVYSRGVHLQAKCAGFRETKALGSSERAPAYRKVARQLYSRKRSSARRKALAPVRW